MVVGIVEIISISPAAGTEAGDQLLGSAQSDVVPTQEVWAFAVVNVNRAKHNAIKPADGK
jgi:hypothetical protein